MSHRAAILICVWLAVGAFEAAARPLIELRLDFVAVANADALRFPSGAKALREMQSNASKGEGQRGLEDRGTMAVSCASGQYVEGTGLADVKAELTASPDSKWINATVSAAMQGASFITTINTPPDRPILLAALQDPKKPDARTLLVFATLSFVAP